MKGLFGANVVVVLVVDVDVEVELDVDVGFVAAVEGAVVRTQESFVDPDAHQSIGAYRIFFDFLSTHTVMVVVAEPTVGHCTSIFAPHVEPLVYVIANVVRFTHAEIAPVEEPSLFQERAVWVFVHFEPMTNDLSALLTHAVTVPVAARAGIHEAGITAVVTATANRKHLVGTRIQVRYIGFLVAVRKRQEAPGLPDASQLELVATTRRVMRRKACR